MNFLQKAFRRQGKRSFASAGRTTRSPRVESLERRLPLSADFGMALDVGQAEELPSFQSLQENRWEGAQERERDARPEAAHIFRMQQAASFSETFNTTPFSESSITAFEASSARAFTTSTTPSEFARDSPLVRVVSINDHQQMRSAEIEAAFSTLVAAEPLTSLSPIESLSEETAGVFLATSQSLETLGSSLVQQTSSYQTAAPLPSRTPTEDQLLSSILRSVELARPPAATPKVESNVTATDAPATSVQIIEAATQESLLSTLFDTGANNQATESSPQELVTPARKNLESDTTAISLAEFQQDSDAQLAGFSVDEEAQEVRELLKSLHTPAHRSGAIVDELAVTDEQDSTEPDQGGMVLLSSPNSLDSYDQLVVDEAFALADVDVVDKAIMNAYHAYDYGTSPSSLDGVPWEAAHPETDIALQPSESSEPTAASSNSTTLAVTVSAAVASSLRMKRSRKRTS